MAPRQWGHRLGTWIDERFPIFSGMHHQMYEYPMPRNLNYWWNFGSLAGFILLVMLLSGIFLSMQYQPNTGHAFDSVERIMRDVNYGWFIRYLHQTGSSLFFAIVYVHIFRGFYYGSYKSPREITWITGVLIFLTMMATAFMGYVLVWGQMSFWAATVITNLFSAFPLIGESVTTWLWGGYSVDDPTLNRFYTLHFLLPFVIFLIVGLHLVALHTTKSNNPLGIEMKGPHDSIPFHPYYTVKDLVGLAVLSTLFAAMIFFAPDVLSEPENFIPANPLVTPEHIVPEWYFLPFYAILRAVPDIWIVPAKLAGVIAMFGATMVWLFVPWLDTSKVRSAHFRPLYRIAFWLLVINCIVLGWCGKQTPEGIYLTISRISTAYYFFHFLILLPVLGWIEKPKQLPHSISRPILREDPDGASLRAAAVGGA
ncbi:MAG: cytochrome b N-terminal domain-containing protein [Hyphomicrobiales bacterium]|nr:cytochrome b N-terminal domain-containing protein [Hyphomicrobiales bacterium]